MSSCDPELSGSWGEGGAPLGSALMERMDPCQSLRRGRLAVDPHLHLN